MKNIITNTIIPLLLAVTALLSAGIPYYNGIIDAKEEEKGQIVSSLLSSMECKMRAPIK